MGVVDSHLSQESEEDNIGCDCDLGDSERTAYSSTIGKPRQKASRHNARKNDSRETTMSDGSLKTVDTHRGTRKSNIYSAMLDKPLLEVRSDN